MQELEVTFGRALSVWWLLLWRGFLGAFVLSFIVGFVFGLVYGILGRIYGWPVGGAIGGGILGAVSSALWGILVVRMALNKRYSEFRIVLVANSDSAFDRGARIEPTMTR
jgi:hypothetical protein